MSFKAIYGLKKDEFLPKISLKIDSSVMTATRKDEEIEARVIATAHRVIFLRDLGVSYDEICAGFEFNEATRVFFKSIYDSKPAHLNDALRVCYLSFKK